MEGVYVEEVEVDCELEHCRPDMGKRITLLFISGVAIGVMLGALGIGAVVMF